MFVVRSRNVNDALRQIVGLVQEHGQHSQSRAGDVLVLPEPLTTIYSNPRERVLFSTARNANPFFHLVEAMWMLAGCNDLDTVEFFVRRMRNFSDDGKTLHGAYGNRWRNWFHQDQLRKVISLLKFHPNSRRAVIQMWDPRFDLYVDEDVKDVPCNITIHVQLVERSNERKEDNDVQFDLFGRQLDMTVFCRSNDIIWGLTGANLVHFSILQEYLASHLRVPVGRLYQISNNAHVYKDTFDKLLQNGYLRESTSNHYELPLRPSKIIDDPEHFDSEVKFLIGYCIKVLREENNADTLANLRNILWKNSIFPEVVLPMIAAYCVFRKSNSSSRYNEMLDIINLPNKYHDESDWLVACGEWVSRNVDKE